MRKIAEVKIKSITPILMGGSQADYSDKILRLPSIRGCWRWLLRAIIAAAAGELNKDEIDAVKKTIPCILGGALDREVFSSRIIVRGVTEIKKYDVTFIKQNIIKDIQRIRCSNTGKHPLRIDVNYTHQRLNLLWMDLDKQIIYDRKGNLRKEFLGGFKLLQQILKDKGANRVEWKPKSPGNVRLFYDKGIRKQYQLTQNQQRILHNLLQKFEENLLTELLKRLGFIEGAKIELYSMAKTSDVEELLAIYSIALTFLLMGLGKGARRGLGAIKIIDIVSKDPNIEAQIIEINDLIKRLEEGEEKVIQQIIENNIKLAKNLLKKVDKKWKIMKAQAHYQSLPPIPSLTRGFFHIFVKRVSGGIWSEICNLNNDLFMRGGSLGLILRGISNPRNASVKLQHYILGLPRSAKGKAKFKAEINIHKGGQIALVPCKKDKTGFIYSHKIDQKEEERRRASPVFLTAIDDKTIIISIFKSRDWPTEKIYWYTTHKSKRSSLPHLVRVYQNLISNLRNILRIKGFTQIV